VLDSDKSSIRFNIPRTMLPHLPAFFERLETVKQQLGVIDMQLSLTTLEEVRSAV
jgi:hypothetical protein